MDYNTMVQHALDRVLRQRAHHAEKISEANRRLGLLTLMRPEDNYLSDESLELLAEILEEPQFSPLVGAT